MIALAADCLMFRLSNGECIPFSSDMIAIEMMGDASRVLDREFVQHAAKAVFYYFKQDLNRESVTAVEFSQALEFILQEFELKATQRSGRQVLQADLVQLAFESGKGCELFFFPRLREELRSQLRKEPREVQFRGLRRCVKRLAGAQRWTARCQELQDQIVEFLRNCFTAESRPEQCALVVH